MQTTFINCCISHYKFNPFVQRAVKLFGTSYSNLPIPDALVPSEEIAVVEKYPLPKLNSALFPSYPDIQGINQSPAEPIPVQAALVVVPAAISEIVAEFCQVPFLENQSVLVSASKATPIISLVV